MLMYFLYCLVLLFGVYLAPALAFYPSLLVSSRTAVVIPFVSLFIITVCKILLAAISSYTHEAVMGLTILFCMVSSFRLVHLFRLARAGHQRFEWPKMHAYLYLINLLIVMTLFFDISLSGFATNDEIYSWNMWAIQHLSDQPIDYYYTQQPYPQLFAILISYCYQLLGSIDLQLPVKGLFILFPFCALTTIGLCIREIKGRSLLLYIILIIIVIYGIGLRTVFDDALADPLMAAALVASVYLYLEYRDNGNQNFLLYLSIVCGAVAFYSKQQALVWVLFALPAISLLDVFKKRIPAQALIPVAGLTLLAILWMLTEGRGFQDNEGVVAASQQGRDALQQLLYAINRYFLNEPLLLILLLATFINLLVERRNIEFFILLIFPGILLWFLFGAYDLRLGMHSVLLLALFLSSADYTLLTRNNFKWFENSVNYCARHHKPLLAFLGAICSISTVISFYSSVNDAGKSFDFDSGSKIVIAKFFGKDSDYVYDEILGNENNLLWMPSNYIYGVFYGHTKVMRPDYDESSDYSARDVLQDILDYHPDFLFDAGEFVQFGPGSEAIRELANIHCPFLLTVVASPPNRYGYTTYQLNRDEELMTQCKVKFESI